MRIIKGLVEHASKKHPRWRYTECIYDIVFIINVNSRGWIVEKILKCVEEESGLHCGWIYAERNDTLSFDPPPARAYLFGHYGLAAALLAKYANLWKGDRHVYFTHPDFSRGVPAHEALFAMQHLTHIFCMNSAHKKLLISFGLDRRRISVVVGGADPELFKPHQRATGKIGIVSAFYERKNPDLLLRIVEASPSQEFLLIAPHPGELVNKNLAWDCFKHIDRLRSLANFEIKEARYEIYPELYANVDVFLSLSSLEGGPIPLLEAMLVDAVPVVTDTGFARDVIKSPQDGYIISTHPTIDEVLGAIEKAFNHRGSVRTRAEKFSWAYVGRRICRTMNLRLDTRGTLNFAEGGGCGVYLREGWRSQDRNGVWAASPISRLYIPFASRKGNWLNLVVEAWTLSSVEHLPIEINVNGRPVGLFVLSGRDRRKWSMKLRFAPLYTKGMSMEFRVLETVPARRFSAGSERWFKLETIRIAISE